MDPTRRDPVLRPLVPHDYHRDDKHLSFCDSFGSNMITNVVGYHPRTGKGTFGATNRMKFLQETYQTQGPTSVCPTYPAAYHGPGGESRHYVLGLTEAGCPSSNHRVMEATLTFGRPQVDTINVSKVKQHVPEKQERSSCLPHITETKPIKQKSLPKGVPRNIYDVLRIKSGISIQPR